MGSYAIGYYCVSYSVLKLWLSSVPVRQMLERSVILLWNWRCKPCLSNRLQ